MRGRVRNNYFSVRVGIAQKATFARDAARCIARARICVSLATAKKKEKKREKGEKSTRPAHVFEDRE